MIQISIHLPTRYRLDLKLVKKRKPLDSESLKINFGEVSRSRKGNKLSRFFRLAFENKKIKKLTVSSLAALVYVSSFVPAKASDFENITESVIQPPIVLETEKSVQYPLENVSITQKHSFFHPAIDLDGVTGDPIYPIKDGIVEKVETLHFGYGKYIVISHGNLKSLYAHLSKIEVSVGQEVIKSDKIGELGATGWSNGDHLHLEIYENGKNINPLNVLSK